MWEDSYKEIRECLTQALERGADGHIDEQQLTTTRLLLALAPGSMTRTAAKLFLEHLARQPRNAFELRFSTISLRLQLCHHLTTPELELLYDAALLGAICTLVLNGVLGGKQARYDQECRRNDIERSFMLARDNFISTAGWQNMPEFKKEGIRRHCLNVVVYEENLAL
jgi:hypothetical protein